MRPESTPFPVNHLRLSYRDGSIHVRSRCLRTVPLRRDPRPLLPRSEAEVHGEGRPGSDRKGHHRHWRKRRYRQGYMQGTHFPFGLGFRRVDHRSACVQVLLEKNAKVYLAARSEARAKAAIAELLGETGKEAIWLELDLSSFQSIEKAAAEFHRYVVVA